MTHLKRLLEEQAQKSRTGKIKISTIALYLGVEPRPHYPKMRDTHGNKIADPETGRDMVSEYSDGDTYTLSELGTSKIVKIVTLRGLDLELGKDYRIEGFGYDMRSSNMIFIDEDGLIDEAEIEAEE
ncbi:hypothetical protein HO995_10715, partial [Streptococcus suis]|nr:hypothetical protein [Streptococcus suis]